MELQAFILFIAFCVCTLIIVAIGAWVLLGVSPVPIVNECFSCCCRHRRGKYGGSDSEDDGNVEKRRALVEKDIDCMRTQIREDKAGQADFMETVFG